MTTPDLACLFARSLTADPYETRDVAAEAPAVVTAIKKLILGQTPPLSCECFQC